MDNAGREYVEGGAYGRGMADLWQLDDSSSLTNTTVDKGFVAVTQIRSPVGVGINDPVPLEDASMIAVQLNPYQGRLWLDGREVAEASTVAGGMHIYDLRRDTMADLQSAFHCVQFYLPRATMTAVADDIGLRRFAHLLEYHDGGRQDPVLHGLALSLVPSLATPETADALFVDHVCMAAATHLLRNHGDFRSSPGETALRSRLAPWQERVAKEYLLSRTHGGVSLAELAGLCGLSPGYFTRAFKQSTGQPPYAWLQRMRISRARNLLAGSDLPIAQIALECGFASQSHMTRIFTPLTGMSPAQWRRRHR